MHKIVSLCCCCCSDPNPSPIFCWLGLRCHKFSPPPKESQQQRVSTQIWSRYKTRSKIDADAGVVIFINGPWLASRSLKTIFIQPQATNRKLTSHFMRHYLQLSSFLLVVNSILVVHYTKNQWSRKCLGSIKEVLGYILQLEKVFFWVSHKVWREGGQNFSECCCCQAYSQGGSKWDQDFPLETTCPRVQWLHFASSGIFAPKPL